MVEKFKKPLVEMSRSEFLALEQAAIIELINESFDSGDDSMIGRLGDLLAYYPKNDQVPRLFRERQAESMKQLGSLSQEEKLRVSRGRLDVWTQGAFPGEGNRRMHSGIGPDYEN